MIKYVLLDLDNTLIDFTKCARHAIEEGFSKYGLPYRDETFPIFLRENCKIWRRHESGEVPKDYISKNRWNIIFSYLGISFDGEVFERFFEGRIGETAYPVDEAQELLEYLYGKYEIFIVSNGFRAVQHNRIKIIDFGRFFSGVIVSEDTGAAKPSKKFFDYCFENIDGISKDNCILIGDSLSADISGGNAYGLKTVWFDLFSQDEPTEASQPTYRVHALREIKDIL